VGFAYRLTDCPAEENAMHLLCKQGIMPDVVLCPFSLPDTNVLRMMNAARKLGCQAPFILLAYDLAEEIAIELLSAGIEDYITRTTLKRLPVAIRKALQRHQTHTELRMSHARIKASEQAIRGMVRNMPMEVAMLDTDLRYLVISEAWATSMQLSEDEIIGRHYYELSPNLPEKWKTAHQRGLAGETLSHDCDPYDYKGETRWLKWKLNPWYNADGVVGGIVLFVENITEDIRSEQKQREQNERLALAVEAAHIGVWSWNILESTFEVSARCAEIMGMDNLRPEPIELVSRVHDRDRIRISQSLQDAIHGQKRFNEEYTFVRPDGTEVIVNNQGQALYDENGVGYKMHGVFIDRTERARMEQRVRESEELFRDMAENITEVFWLTDYQANRILYMSPQYEKLYGMTVQSIYDSPASWDTHIHPEDRAGIVQQFKEEAAKGTYDVKYRILHPDGRTLWVNDRAFPIRNEQGEVLRIAGISRDVTHEHTA
jgi:PAS domain S-box-containing protein